MSQSAPPFTAPSEPLPPPEVRPLDPAERARPTLLRGAEVLDVAAGRLAPGQDVLLVEGRVEAVGTSLGVPDGARVVDLDGRVLMPGLLSLHVHPGMMAGLRMDPAGLSPERMRRDLQVWLRYGVTTVQSMGSDRAFAFDVQREQREGAFLGARLFTVGHGFGVQGGVPPFQMDPPGPLRLDDEAAIRRALEDLAARGASGVKLWYDDWYGQFPRMAPQVARTILETCQALGLRTYAHVYYVDDALRLVDWGLDVLAHMPRDREIDQDAVDRLLARGIGIIPTLTVPETNVAYVDRPDWVMDPLFGRFLPPGSAEFLRDERFLATIRARAEFPALKPDFERAVANTRRLHEAGARIAFGTDGGVSNRVVGFAEHRELELLVTRCGVSPADALRMATVVGADVLGEAGALGQVAPGHHADLVVLSASPLEDIRNTRAIDAVWLGGVQACGPLDAAPSAAR